MAARSTKAFYPGCLVLQRMPQYELATRAVLGALGIELEIVQQTVCCGSPVELPTSGLEWFTFVSNLYSSS